MRYLDLAEAFIIAEAVTGFSDTDFYPTLIEKAAVLCVRIAKNHLLPDGNDEPAGSK